MRLHLTYTRYPRNTNRPYESLRGDNEPSTQVACGPGRKTIAFLASRSSQPARLTPNGVRWVHRTKPQDATQEVECQQTKSININLYPQIGRLRHRANKQQTSPKPRILLCAETKSIARGSFSFYGTFWPAINKFGYTKLLWLLPTDNWHMHQQGWCLGCMVTRHFVIFVHRSHGR